MSEKALHEKIMESPLLLGIIVFLLLVILNFACLTNPPYWDDILGLHNQAIWLAKNNFDTAGLWRTGPYLAGGSNVYRFGIMPYFYGILYSVFPAGIVHILGHLFNIGCIALAFGASYTILRKFDISRYTALLWCAAALSEPVMSGRIAALGQECPLLCGTILSIYFLSARKYWRGLLFLILAMLCKTTPGILAIAFIIWVFIDIISAQDKWQERLREYVPYLIAGAFPVAFFFGINFIFVDDKMHGGKITLYKCLMNFKFHFLELMPVQFAVLAIIGLTALVKLKTLFRPSPANRLSLLLIITIGGFWSAYLLYYNSLPRYTAFIVFPMYIFLALNIPDKKHLLSIIPALLLPAGLLNSSGRFYPPLKGWFSRSGETLERSREYLPVLWDNQAACKFLEIKFFDRPIVAKWPFIQMLTVPEMGYVSKALPNVYSACPPIKYGDVKIYRPNVKMPGNTLYIFSANTFEPWKEFGPSLAPERGKKYSIILQSEINNGRLIIYGK